LLTGATVMLLVAACAAGLGASKAAAASQHATTKVTKISACGFVAHKAGIYELTQSVTDSGSECITVAAGNVTLYLDSHTITGSGTDTCIVAAGGVGGTIVKDTVIGGKMPKPKAKPKASKPATLTHCETGLVFAVTSGATASNLNIVAPASSGSGVVVTESEGANLSHINVPMHTGNSAIGLVLAGGADNVVMNSTVNYDGSHQAFLVEGETGDTFTHDTVNDPYSSGSAGVGFSDVQSSRDTYSHCSSSGQLDGFNVSSEGDGPVTLTYDKATGSAANASSVGFEITGALQYADSSSPFHTLVSHNKTNGFAIGFEDNNGGIPATPASEKWIDNTADNYSGAGFEITYPTDYTMTGNIADANTSGKKYTGGTTFGFLLTNVSPAFPFASFANNQAYDSEVGFLSPSAGVGGKGNIAKRNKVNSIGVEISG
jgi:hypothetical protein